MTFRRRFDLFLTSNSIYQILSSLLAVYLLGSIIGTTNCRPSDTINNNFNHNITSSLSPSLTQIASTTSINQTSNSTRTPSTAASPLDQTGEFTLPNPTNDSLQISEEEIFTENNNDDGVSTTTLASMTESPSLETLEEEMMSNSNSTELTANSYNIPIVRESRGVAAPVPSDANTTIIAISTTSTPIEEDVQDGRIRRCNAGNSTTLNKCLRRIVQDLKPKLNAGIPELHIPPIDPLHLRQISFEHGSGPIKVIATFKNVEATGLGNMTKTEFEVDMKRRILEFDLEIPIMQIIGEYELSGNLFFFPIGGKGNFWLHLDRISAKGQGKLGLVMLNDRKTVQMSKVDIELDINNVKTHLTNLFNGDPILGNVINKFLNENSKDIFDEIRPQVANQIGAFVQRISNGALAVVGADTFADVRNSKLDIVN